MKKTSLLLITILFLTDVYSQNTEYGYRLNSGLFSFSGQSSEAYTFINYNLDKNDGYTNNPYGSKSGLSYGISANISRITKNNMAFGIDLGYELLRSKIYIDRVSEHNGTTNQMIEATGKTYLNNSFINLFPSIGYRFSTSNLFFDLSGGIDFAYCLSTTEKGSATSSTRKYVTKRDRKTINMDFRPRIQIGIYKNKTGIYIGYSKGVKNYKPGYAGGVNEVFGNIFRFGIKYRIK